MNIFSYRLSEDDPHIGGWPPGRGGGGRDCIRLQMVAEVRKKTIDKRGSMTFLCGSGSTDPYLRLTDPDPDTTPDPTSFLFFLFFSYNLRYSQAHYHQSYKLNFLLSFILKVLLQYSPLKHLYEKREGSGSILLTDGTGSWRPKNMQIWIPNTANEKG